MNFLGALPEAGSTDDEQAHALKTQWRNLNTDFINKHPHLFEASERKFNAWLRSNDALNRQAAETQAQQQREQRSKENTQRREILQQYIQNAELALTEGHTAELTQLLASIDTLIHTSSTSPALNQRIDFLRRELLRLKDWQRWSGGKSREQLAEEANELMQLATSKVDLKAHAEAIQKLRLQWKTLDKLGGGSNQALCQQFDQALNQAYTPIAAQIEKRATARQENLAAREQIIAKLIEDKNRLLPSPVESNDTPNEIDWRSIIHTLEHARIQWKKLGPVEHALPKEALSGDTAVTTRYAAAIEALETPLMKIQNEALRQRRKIIQSATALGESDLLNIHLVDKIKQLQTQWQTAAKTLPLLRHEEHKLWTEFKTATDTLFKTRDTARAQQEAATQEQIKAREALIEKLTQALSLEITTEIRKVISETEKAWRDLLALPKPLESKLTSRLRDAKHTLQQHINQLDRQAIEARFSALEAAITLCQQREALYQATAEPDIASVDKLQHRWEQNTHLPEQWKLALNSRFQSAKQPSSNSPDPKLLNTLLTLELACDIDSPKEFTTERQQLKMLQLKQALERGDSTQLSMTDIERLVLQVAAQPTSDLLVSARLNKIIQSLKNRTSPR
jgi:hypothetical protein